MRKKSTSKVNFFVSHVFAVLLYLISRITVGQNPKNIIYCNIFPFFRALANKTESRSSLIVLATTYKQIMINLLLVYPKLHFLFDCIFPPFYLVPTRYVMCEFSLTYVWRNLLYISVNIMITYICTYSNNMRLNYFFARHLLN